MNVLAWLMSLLRPGPVEVPQTARKPMPSVTIDEPPANSVESVIEPQPQEVKAMSTPSYSPAFLSAVNYVLDHERGYVNNPKDPGGPTNMGITWETLARWRGVHRSKIKPEDVKNMTRDEAIAIYDAMYWDTVRADRLPPALAYAAFDFAINSGPARAIKEIQKLVGTKADGLIGGHTMRQINAVNDRVKLVNDYLDARLAWMKKARHRKTKALLWPTFKNGWSKRVADVRKRSLRHVQRNGGGSW